MQLNSLFADLDLDNLDIASFPQFDITGITTDPGLCTPGYLYVADECETVDSKRLGVRLDGRDYITEAVRNGAVAILTTKDVTLHEGTSAFVISCVEPLAILGTLCARYYSAIRPKEIALVTGTNGKTSTVNFCRQLWSGANLPSCSVGNLGGICSDGTVVWNRDPVLSVPETVTLHKMLNELATRSINHVAMEATSHALHDHRLTGVSPTVAAFTNLTRDHLDFHGTMEEYFRVKMTLFTDVLPVGGTAVINADTPWSERAIMMCKARGHKVVTYGLEGSDVSLVGSMPTPTGQTLILDIAGKRYEAELNLFGRFQAINVLCALAIVINSGVEIEVALKSISALKEIEGRLNVVAVTASGGKVVVDYAHSPDAIRAALEGCRSFTKGRLTIVFGCNGERDAGKRSEMGQVASELADHVIVTDGHPRTEDPGIIRRAVLVGAPGAREIASRTEAIESAIREMGPGDTVLLAGLGHEDFRTVGSERIPYSDTETARQIVESLRQEHTARAN